MRKGIAISRKRTLSGEFAARKKKSRRGHASERVGNLARYATVIVNVPKEDEEEENAAGNRKQPARNPVGGNQGWEKENAPTSAPITLGINGGAAGRFTKQATTLPVEGNTPSAGTKAQALQRVLMGVHPILQNTIRGGNGMGEGTETTAAPTEWQQKGEGRVSTGWSALTEVMKMFGPEGITQEFSEKLLKWQADVGGDSKKCATFKI